MPPAALRALSKLQLELGGSAACATFE